MTKKTESLLPLSLARTRRRFEAWRLRKRPGGRIPEALWAKAVEAAREHGLARTSQALRLDQTPSEGGTTFLTPGEGILPPDFLLSQTRLPGAGGGSGSSPPGWGTRA